VKALLTLAFCALGIAASTADAYRPPSRVLLSKSMERQITRDTRTMRIDLETQAYESDGRPLGAPVVERLLFQSPGSSRREIELPEGLRVEVRDGDKYVTKIPGQPDKASKAPIDLLHDQVTTYPPMDDTRATERLLKDMRALNINPEVVSFARFDGRVAYLIGSKPWEENKAQLWLDKDTLLILRVVMVAPTAAGAKPDDKPRKTDVRYLGWGSAVGGNWFPQTIEVWDGDRLVRRSITKNVERNVSFDATLFQIR
jgi:outer membrane lipoprotein-sorting protein